MNELDDRNNTVQLKGDFYRHVITNFSIHISAGLVGKEIQDLTVAALEGLSSEVIPKIPATTLKVKYLLFWAIKSAHNSSI